MVGKHFFLFFFDKQTHTHRKEGKRFQHKDTLQLHSKAMVTFKGKLYYMEIIFFKCIQHINVIWLESINGWLGLFCILIYHIV